MTRDGALFLPYLSFCLFNIITADLFQNNAKVIKDLVTGVAKFCPRAFVLIITNPINSTLPIAVEVLKRHNVLDPQRVFGATTLDVVRASTFLAHVLQSDNPKDFKIPVVGGHSGSTILPLYSQCKPSGTLNMEELDSLTHHKSLPNIDLLDC